MKAIINILYESIDFLSVPVNFDHTMKLLLDRKM